MEENKSKQDEIILKIEEIYVSTNKAGKPTGKSFISHLLRSYFPIGKAQRVVDVPEKPMKCAITGQKLFALGELWNGMQNREEFMTDFKKSILYSLDPEKNEKAEHPFQKIANGRIVGLTGKKTDTYLCQEAYQGLYNWYANKILQGDNHVNWLAKDMLRKSAISFAREKLPEVEDQKKLDRLEQISKHPQRATTSLGDFTALKELQEKLKLQEKK